VLEFRYEDGRDDGEENWHVVTDGEGYSLVIRNEAGPIEAWGTGTGWRPSVRIGGSPGEPDGPLQDVDFDNDGDVDADDLDLLSAGVRQANLAFDLNLDGVVDADDRRLMLSALGASVGDSNLDGVFSSSDMVMVFVAGQYEDDIPDNSGWAEGDWDGNGDFTTSDLVFVFQAGTYVAAAEVAPSELAAAVDFLFAQDEDLRRTRPSVQSWTP
jgi:hypothetical protein